jgi:predicted ferric reductase
MYIVHHLSGAIAFVLVMFHPLFISGSYLTISIISAAELLWPSMDNLPVLYGIVALFLTIILLVITLYIQIEYDLWKITHKFLGVALFFIVLHVTTTPSSLSSQVVLQIYIFTFLGLAVISYIYRTLLGRYLVPKRTMYVSELKHVSQDVLELSLETEDKRPILYRPGQFMFVEPMVLGIPKESHPFSVISKKDTIPLQFAFSVVGGFTSAMRLLEKGSMVKVEGPFGRFGYDFHPLKKQIWIGGGIGITPFLSMARSLSSDDPFEIHFFYSYKDEKLPVYAEEFEKIMKANPQFHFYLHNSTTDGRISAESISTKGVSIEDTGIFICGPAPMMLSLKKQFIEKGIRKSKIYTEEFALQ